MLMMSIPGNQLALVYVSDRQAEKPAVMVVVIAVETGLVMQFVINPVQGYWG